MVKVIAWYDNEYGYANRLVEEVIMMGRRQQQTQTSVSTGQPVQQVAQPTEQSSQQSQQ